MTDNIKAKILEFAAIAKECPENLQEKCFELLLTDFLSQRNIKITRKNDDGEFEKEMEIEKPIDRIEKSSDRQQEDIQERDLHVKVKQMLKKENLTVEQINQIFYKEDGEIKPLYDDLKTTKAAEGQIRIALLYALQNAIQSGDFKFNGEEVRKETQSRKCFDAANFAANFKNNKLLFDSFESYDRNNPVINLSTDGKTKLAQIIKEMQ